MGINLIGLPLLRPHGKARNSNITPRGQLSGDYEQKDRIEVFSTAILKEWGIYGPIPLARAFEG